MNKLLTYYFLLFTALATAQTFEGNLKIENIIFPEGNQLPYVYDIAQDNKGLIWMRIGGDFYTYNGNKLSKVEQEVLGFSSSGTGGLFSNTMQPFFYMTQDNLIVYYHTGSEVVQGTDNLTENLRLSPKPTAIGNIFYIGISEDNVRWGLKCSGDYDNCFVVRAGTGGAFQVIDSINVSWYYGATLVRGDRFFIKLRDRIEEFDSSGRVKTYPFPTGADPVAPSMVKDAENTIWVMHSPDKTKDQYGVYYLKEGQDEFIRLPAGNRFPQEEKRGKLFADGNFIWHRGYPFRLSRMRISDGSFEDFTDKIIEQSLHFPFYHSTLLNIFRDRSGEIWLTTRAGVVKMTIEEDLFQKYKLKKTTFDSSDESCLIRGITEDEAGNIYLSHLNGIAVLNPKTGQISALPVDIPPQPQKVHGLTYARGTLFWNEYAIDLRTYQSKKLFPTSNYEYLTHGLNPEGTRLWIAVNDWPFQFYCYNIEKGESMEINLPEKAVPRLNDEIRQVHYSPTTGTLFLAVWMEGLLELDTTGKILHQYDDSKSKGDSWHGNAMYGLHEDEAGHLWVAHGADAGLSKMDLKTREITEYPYQVNSFTGTLKRVFHILPGKGDRFWLVTEKGTLRLDKKTGELTRFPMFPTLFGMAFNNLPGYASKAGTLYFGTPNGNLNAFEPEALYEKAGFEQRYPVVINRFERFNRKRDTLITQLKNLIHLSEIHLTHQDRYFNLEFFVPDYRNPSQNLYSYWLQGYDNDWNPPARINQLRYENLPAGEYFLHIRGGLTPDYYKSSERVIKVIVYPAWYKTWWAYSFFAAGILGLFYLFYRYQVGQQLKRAKAERLKELDILKTRLYTNITHEFRTPLTVIMGMTDNIRGHQSEKNLIGRNSKNLLRLVNQLLDLSKLDSGTMKMDPIRADIINYLQYLTESFYSMAEEKKIRLMFYPETKKLHMDFDEVKIQHIIYNLLSNAIKFSKSGDKVVLHATETEINDQAQLKLKVTDTGIGIAEKDLKHIFDRFYQADATSTRKGEGTGIGLALTKELVEVMGGKISVKSQLGEGTEFLILLPIKRLPETLELEMESAPSKKNEQEFVPEKPPHPPSTIKGMLKFSQDKKEQFGKPAPTPNAFHSLPSLPFRELGGEKGENPQLLIIEDNWDVTIYMSNLLNLDYNIMAAENGKEGIEKALKTIPDIIISDVMMPEKDGFEVCQILKNDERTSHIPIILLTAKATTHDRIEGLSGGADAYLTKPFNKKELFVRLEQLIMLRQKFQERYASFKEITSSKPTLEEVFLQKLIKTVEDRLDDPDLGVKDLCRAANLSNMQVNRKLKALTGKTPSRFIRSIRLQKAMELLQTTDLNISEIAYDVGFSDPNYFSRSFSEEFGHPPNVVRK